MRRFCHRSHLPALGGWLDRARGFAADLSGALESFRTALLHPSLSEDVYAAALGKSGMWAPPDLA
jgi:hypothetical protein